MPPAKAKPAPFRVVHDDPRYIKARDKHTEIQVKQGAVQKQIDDELHRQNQFRQSTLNALRAQALVDDMPMPTLAEATPLTELYEQLRVLELARDIAFKRLEGVEKEVSREILTEIAPQYRELICRQMAASKEMLAAVEAEADLMDSLEAGGVHIGMMERISVLGADHLRSRVSEAAERSRNFHGFCPMSGRTGRSMWVQNGLSSDLKFFPDDTKEVPSARAH